MADNSWHSKPKQPAESAVLDMDIEEMEIIDDGHSDVSDYDSSFHDDRTRAVVGREAKGSKTFVEDIKQRMGENVTQMVWQAGTQGARKAWTLYGNIDILRPYFDVEPKEVQQRLLSSLVPVRPADKRQEVSRELYGPTMVVMTLIALLLYQMKTAEHKVEEGTLMGAAFGTCFMYWFGVSSLIWFVSYVCNVRITILQILSMVGYGLFGHCIVLFFGTVIHTSHDHMLFYLLWAVFGGLSTLRMAGIIMSRTRGKTERLVVIGTIAAFHLLFLLYLHFAYHTVVEELSDALHENIVPLPAAQQAENVINDSDFFTQKPEVLDPAMNAHQMVSASAEEVGGAALPTLKEVQSVVDAVAAAAGNDSGPLHKPLDLRFPEEKLRPNMVAKLANSQTIQA